jgi:hypothetical protein
MRLLFTGVCCLFLSGCVTTQIDRQWVNQFNYDHNIYGEKQTEAELKKDQETCQESAFYRARGSFFMDKEEYARLYKKCMEEERGWRRSQGKKRTPEDTPSGETKKPEAKKTP